MITACLRLCLGLGLWCLALLLAVPVGAQVNQEPAVIGFPATTDEDVPTTFLFLSIADPDVMSGDLEVEIEVASGTLDFQTVTGLSFSLGGDGDAHVIFQGQLGPVNTALATLEYLGNQDFNGADALDFRVNDLGNTGTGGPMETTRLLGVTVDPVNDAPTLTLPGVQNTTEEAPVLLSAVTVADVDATSLRVTVSVSNGGLTLGTLAGITINSGSNGGPSLQITGTISALNDALADVTYLPDLDFDASDVYALSVDDLGQSGAGGAMNDSDNVQIVVAGINDAPQIMAPISLEAQQNELTPVPAVAISDVDLGGDTFIVTLSADRGSLHLGVVDGLAFLAGANGSSQMSFEGSSFSVAFALGSLEYLSPPSFQDTDNIRITADDQGSTGSGGALSDMATIPVTVLAPIPAFPY